MSVQLEGSTLTSVFYRFIHTLRFSAEKFRLDLFFEVD